MAKSKIVILGAGYAGLRTVKKLQKKNVDAEIILIDRNDYHYQSHCLHQVAAGTEAPEKIMLPIKDVINDKVQFIQDTVELVDKENKKVQLASKGEISYDILVLSLGFESETFGIPGVDENSKALVDIDTAVAARDYLESNLANYAKSQDENDLHIVVCGAGFTSIEYLGELTNRLPKLVAQYNLPADKVTISCVEAMPTLLPMFNAKLSEFGINKLKERGVKFYVGTPIKEIKAGTVCYQEGEELKELHASTIIWTTGVRGSAVMGKSGFAERRGRVVVDSHLLDPDYQDVFILGDVSASMDPTSDRPYPTTAQIAMKQADHAAANIVAKLNGQPMADFTFQSAGTLCSIGNNQGIAEVGAKKLQFKGWLASVMKKGNDDRILIEIAGWGMMFKKGRFDFWH